MGKAYDFLKECGAFYVSTINGDFPATRPFGAIMEYDGYLYLSTANTKSVYTQMKNNSRIQIVSLKAETREWVRITGKAIETSEIHLKQAMLDTCPILKTRFVAESSNYALFKITEMSAELNSDSGSIKIK